MYHGLTWGPIVRELVAAATGRSIRDIAADEFLALFRYRWNNFGVAESDVPSSHRAMPPARQAPVCSTRASAGRRRVDGGNHPYLQPP